MCSSDLRISYNYFENPWNRSQPWQWAASPIPPRDTSASVNPRMVVLYDRALMYWNNPPIIPCLVNHPLGGYGQYGYNSDGGNLMNALCFDGSAPTVRLRPNLWAGDMPSGILTADELP